MKISIVEDEAVWRDKIKAAVEKYSVDRSISVRIIAYDNGRLKRMLSDDESVSFVQKSCHICRRYVIFSTVWYKNSKRHDRKNRYHVIMV